MDLVPQWFRRLIALSERPWLQRSFESSGRFRLRRTANTQLPLGWLALLGLLTVGLPLAFALGFDGDDGLDALRRHHLDLVSFVAVKPVVASLVFVFLFALSVAISLPGVSFLTMVGGFLFGWMPATALAQVAATAAAVAVFIVARRALHGPVDTHAGPTVRRFSDGFKRNAFGYVMLLHLVPIFPFGMAIALPAACGVRLWTFVIAGFLGVLPSTILLAHLGSGLGGILRSQGPIDLASFLTPQILLAVAGLGALSLLALSLRSVTRRDRI
jgi:uncharacterized membrane protein YdjX (TVP38/TMEM64 family)